MRKKIIGISLALIILSLFFYFLSDSSFGYGTTYSHPKLTKEIVNLYNRFYPENQISLQEIEWLVKGAIEEDTPLRYINHFYDPIYNQPWLGRNPVALTAKDWAQSPNYQLIFAKGNQSWQKAINSYIKGDKKSSFIALGHILHLIEDMAVPEHTRNDTHLPYVDESPYEKWVEQSIQKTNLSFSRTPKMLINLGSYFDSLAFYSNNHFFSKNTINTSKYSYPKLIECNDNLKYGFVSGIKIKYGCGVVEDKIFRLIKITREVDWRNPEIKPIYELDPNVLFDYFSLLGPKAVSHGAGVIKLFFEEAEKQKQLEKQKSWWQKVKEKAGDLFSATLISLVKEEPAPSPAQPAVTPKEEEKEIAQTEQTKTSPDDTLTGVTPTGVISEPQVPKPLIEEPKPEKLEQPQIEMPKIEKPEPPEPESKPEEISKAPEEKSEPENPPASSENNISTGSGYAWTSPYSEPIPEDTQAPETYATSTLFANSQTIATTTAIFEFSSSEENSTFECQLDNATSTTCTSSQIYENLFDGTHIFQVRAIDQASNQDQIPATITWTIDITSPVLSNISASASRNSATISWVSSEPGIFQINYGTSTSYGFTTATTSVTNLSLTSLSLATTYHYQIQAQDQLGNSTSSPDSIFTTSSQANNLVISEIAAQRPNRAKDEFIEIYNPTSQTINFKDWSIQYASATATTTWTYKYFSVGNTATSTLPNFLLLTGQYFLLTSATTTDGYSYPAQPDLMAMTKADNSLTYLGLADSGGKIRLLNPQDEVVDLVGWGLTTIGAETDPVILTGGWSWGSLERKANATSTAESLATSTDKWLGNAYDSDNNSQDFVLQTSPTPQNSLSLIEPRTSLPSLATDSSWSMKQRDSKRQAQILVSGLASTTLQVSSSTLVSSPPENLISLSLSNSQILVTSTKGLFALDLTNINQLWFYPTDDIATPPLISSDGTIYVRADDALYALTSSTSSASLKWKYPLSGNYYRFSLNIDKNGIIYTVAGSVASGAQIYAFFPDGKVKWVFNVSQPPVSRSFAGTITSSAIDNERERIYFSIDNYLYALDFNGNFVWDFRNSPLFPTSTTTSFSSPTIGNDGTIYVSSSGQAFASGGFYGLNPEGPDDPDGIVKWFNSTSTTIGYGGNASRSPAIGPDGTVYFVDVRYSGGGAGAELFAFYPLTGQNKWHVSLPNLWTSSPIVTEDTVYVAAGKYILAFDFINGQRKWQWAGPDGAYFDSSFGAVNSDGSLYFTSRGTFYRLSN